MQAEDYASGGDDKFVFDLSKVPGSDSDGVLAAADSLEPNYVGPDPDSHPDSDGLTAAAAAHFLPVDGEPDGPPPAATREEYLAYKEIEKSWETNTEFHAVYLNGVEGPGPTHRKAVALEQLAKLCPQGEVNNLKGTYFIDAQGDKGNKTYSRIYREHHSKRWTEYMGGRTAYQRFMRNAVRASEARAYVG